MTCPTCTTTTAHGITIDLTDPRRISYNTDRSDHGLARETIQRQETNR